MVTMKAKKPKQKAEASAVMDRKDVEIEDSMANTRKRKSAAPTEGTKKKKKSNTAIVQPPSLEEMKELRDTRNLFHSNLFKLQVKEMLQELQLKAKYVNYIDTWMQSFKSFLEQIKDGLLDNCKLEVPLNLHGLSQRKPFNFQFVKPEAAPYLMGAAATGTLLGPEIIVDVAVPMPAGCFQKDDYLNLIYDHKRALYLTYLANKMREYSAFATDQFAYNYYANNTLKPVLELTPGCKVGKHLKLRIFITSPTAFKLSRFVPWNSNIRPVIFGDEFDENQALTATQHYNANVLFDLTHGQNQEFLTKAFEGKRNFQEGLLLLKVWLRQRQLDVGHMGFSAHILAAFIVYLNQHRLLHQSSSSYQVARTVWNQLAKSDWSQGITLATTQPNELSTISAYYDVCFMDITGYYNLCANVPLAVYRRVCAEAKLVVDLLNDMKINSFPQIFMHKCPLYTRMDHILKINNPTSVDQLLELHCQPHIKYDFANSAYPQLFKLVTDLLLKGLGKRVQAILPLEERCEGWPVDSPAPLIGRSLQLGLILDPEHSLAVLDKGPEAIADDAADFRKFWGDKCELRRFQDGTITESVVWGQSTDSPRQKRIVVRSIVLHLLEHHLQLDASDLQYICDELDIVYTLTPAFKVSKLKTKLQQPLQQNTDAEALTPNIIHCYDALARQLHGLNELPLEIASITGISPVFRYCEPEPLLPQARIIEEKMYAPQVLNVIIQLGQSGKWPSELGALRALKTAFYIKIGELLNERHLTTRLTYDGLLVLKQGYCFKLELAHTKELALLKQEITEKGITRYVDNAESRELEKRHYILPKVNGALHALHQTHGAFGPTVMIAKRWLGAQLLDNGLWPDMATELLVAHIFLQCHAPQQTNSPQMGFMRFLHLLAHSDWTSNIFLLNFNNSWAEEQITELEQNFRSARDSFPPLCIATCYDLHHAGHLWCTSDNPNVPVLARVTLLARHALQLIETSLGSSSLAFVRTSQLFRPSVDGYNSVIQFKPDLIANTMGFDFGSPVVQPSPPNFLLPLVCSVRLPQIVDQLRSAYSEFAAFFYNPYGGKEVFIIWKPDEVFAPKSFKVTDVHASKPTSTSTTTTTSNEKVQVLRDTLLADFQFILKDFYMRISTVDQLKHEYRPPMNRYYNTQFTTDAKSTKAKKSKVNKPIKRLLKGKIMKPLS